MKKYIVFVWVVIFAFWGISCSNTNAPNSDISIEAEKFDDISEPISLVIIVGRHANSGKPTDDMIKTAKGLILKSYITPFKDSNGRWCSNANVSIIVNDGFPTPVKIPTDLLTISGQPYKQNVEDDINSYAESITRLLISDDIKADNEEVDLVQALEQARVLLKGKENKYILILDTGISTTGCFDMRKINIMDDKPVKIVDKLSQEQLPDLDDITVIFDGIGNIPNDPMNGQTKTFSTNQEAKKALKAVWIELLVNRCKANLFENDIGETTPGEDQPYAEGEDGYPYVSTVAFRASLPPEPTVPTVSPDKDNDKEVPPPIDEIFNTNTFFRGNSIKFVDPDGANKILYDIAEKIRDFLNDKRISNEKIYVIGSIANTSENLKVTTNKYSDGRAKAVANKLKKLLKNSGESINRIIPIDAGTTEFSWRDTDEFDSNGVWQDELAQKNRVVAILSSNSEKVQNKSNKSNLQRYIK